MKPNKESAVHAKKAGVFQFRSRQMSEISLLSCATFMILSGVSVLVMSACNSSDEPPTSEMSEFASREFPLAIRPAMGRETVEYLRYNIQGTPEKKIARLEVDREDAVYVAYGVDLILKVKEECEYHSDYFRGDDNRLISYCEPVKEGSKPQSSVSAKKAGDEITEHGYVIVARWDRLIEPKKWQFILKKR